jgi:type III restriction enzyme
MPQSLDQIITNFKDYGEGLPEVPVCITGNLNPSLKLRPYQDEAFGRFIYYLNNSKLRQKPSQVLFHMATGSGKTMIMAGLILYLYTMGYRNFLFFVNNTNIINKTRDNFLNPLSSKYLFSQSITIANKQIKINEVDNFQDDYNDDCLNILFSTIQGLHSHLNNPHENTVTYDDFVDKHIVLISDEAHHTNIDTKNGKLSLEEKEENESWETTINRIFRSNSDNILLEFTATIDITNPLIQAKYLDKIIYNYPLKKFRIEKYSKEVKVLQSDVTMIQRALQAVILSQYRRKVFEKNKVSIKPVLLFKSKTIAESKAFYHKFIEKIRSLKKQDLNVVFKSKERILLESLNYFNENKISLENLIAELKTDFAENKCLEVNSKDESEEKQIIVNTLESDDNEYRAVFAVDKLNEGWDVLNLFDIVRLYDTRDADTKTGKPGKTTIAEAQLIGRGARYCPFQIEQTQSKFQRKYDDDIDNPLRICEELYYHSAYNPKYINELHNALHEIGIKDKNTKEIQLFLKLNFQESDFYKNGFIFTNKQNKYDRSDIFSLSNDIIEKKYHYSLLTGDTSSSIVFDEIKQKGISKTSKDYLLQDFGFPIIQKALSRIEFFWLNNLKSFFPNVESITNFISSKKYLGKIKIEVSGIENDINNLSASQKLEIAINVLNAMSVTLQSDKIEYQGSEEFYPTELVNVFKDKKLNITVNDNGDQEFGIAQSKTTNQDLFIDLSRNDWYVFNDNYGTSEEKRFIKYIDKVYTKLKTKYDDIYLIRNEGHFKLYSFESGRAFEPDFVLFLKSKDTDTSTYYQVVIEPKGEHLFEYDSWKEEFLIALRAKHKINVLWKTKKYIVWGMPFYNYGNIKKSRQFEQSFGKIIQ